jgi:hypothetical protein
MDSTPHFGPVPRLSGKKASQPQPANSFVNGSSPPRAAQILFEAK